MNSTRPALITWIVVSMVLATTAMQAQFTIELEDYNFEDGQFIDNATPGDYGGKGLATPGVDFVDNTPTTRGANEYRAPGAGASGLPQTAASGDSERTAGTAEYDLSSVEIGEWTNYTRTFPAGTYTVTARVQALDDIDPFIARLEKVTSDPKIGNQTSSAYGVLLGRNASSAYGDLPLTDVNGRPVTVALDGEETLRLATQVGSYNINYLTFTPAASPAPMPRIDITAPDNNTGVVPGMALDVSLTPADDGNVAAVQILANSPDGDEIIIAELGSAPFTATWSDVPEGTWRLLGVVVDTAGNIGLSSEITLFADGVAPELQQARGRTIEDVILTFSESMNQESAGDPANYGIVDEDGTALDVLSASVTADGRVILATAEQAVGKNYTLTINALTDLAGNALPDGTTAEFFGNG
ncbi:Ig-like domain-containing protein, partial [Verrucomicrobiales bacterium]|nr:Ig-like domain-containing protein [Verrucomicrobiales bacterium]